MTDQALAIDLTKYIETRLFEDRPHIRNRRIPVGLIEEDATFEAMRRLHGSEAK